MTDHDAALEQATEALNTEAATPEVAAHDEGLASLRAELQTWQDKAYRAAAELENYRKRSQQEVAEARLYAAQGFAKDILAVADNLERALAAPTEDTAALRKGVELTATQLATIFQRNGIVKVESKAGEALNPDQHQAMTEVASEHPAGHIAAEMQAGYTLNGRLLRPALVSVSKGE